MRLKQGLIGLYHRCVLWLGTSLSIRWRFLLVFLVSVVVLVSVAQALLQNALVKYLLERQEEQAELIVKGLLRNLVFDGDVLRSSWVASDAYDQPYSGWYWQITHKSKVLRSRSLWDAEFTLPPLFEEHRIGFITGPNSEFLLLYERIVDVSWVDRPLRVSVAMPHILESGEARIFLGTTFLITIAIAVVMMIALMASVAIGLFPLDRLRVALIEVRDGRKKKLEGPFVKELHALVQSFNLVIERYGQSIERARIYGGNVAHGLKNPLAILRLEINKLGRTKGNIAAIKEIEEQISHMERHIQLELSRVRAAGSRAIPGQHCQADDELKRLLKAIHLLYQAKELDVALKLTSLKVAVEAQDFKEILGNCIDNAFKWARGRLSLTLERQGDQAIIVIEDDGPGIPVAKRKELFRPGARVDEHQSGTGLGLSISRSLVSMYDGTIKLGKSRWKGARVTISVPVAGSI